MKTLARTLTTLVILVAGCLGAYELWNYYMFSPWTRDARVVADVVTVAPDVAGFVNDLRVNDNQFVRKGDILLILDQERYKRALEAADANVAARKAEMLMRQSEAARRVRLTDLSITPEAREDAQHMAAVRERPWASTAWLTVVAARYRPVPMPTSASPNRS
jgi:multidrug resistance efflux pump